MANILHYSFHTGSRRIWFIGSSHVYWANRSASARPGGLNLNLQKIGGSLAWHGKRGMRWGELIPTIERLLGDQPHPEFTEGHPAIEAFVGSVIQRHLKQAVLKELAV